MDHQAHRGSDAQYGLWPDVSSSRGGPDSHVSAAMAILSRETPTPIIIPGLRPKDIQIAKNGLIRFDNEVALSDQAAWTLNVPRDPEFKEEDDGVIRKADDDQKIFLHYRSDLEELLLTHRGIMITDWQRKWFAACNRILTASMAYQLELVRQMDILRPGYDFERRFLDYMEQCLVRVLKYVPREGIIAKDHTDRCAITFHLAESASGLCCHSGFECRPYATPRTPGALCFTGQQLERATHGAIPAVYHKVENNTPDRVRWAVVFFGNMRPK